MSDKQNAGTTGGDGEPPTPPMEKHEYFDMGGSFLSEMTTYLMSSQDNVPLDFATEISDGTNAVKFERTKLVPRAALERAKQDNDFNYKLCHGIALQYHQEMLQTANFVCKECGKSVKMILQTPTIDLQCDPPMILDVMATPVCASKDCMIRAKNSIYNNMASMNELLNRVKERVGDAGLTVNNRPTSEFARICLYCGKTSRELRRCSRCQKVYFCDQVCQQKAWKKHKEECKAPPAASKTD